MNIHEGKVSLVELCHTKNSKIQRLSNASRVVL